MKKIILIIGITLLVSSYLHAAVIDKTQALSIAYSFHNEKINDDVLYKTESNKIHDISILGKSIIYYVETSKGWVLVSSSNKMRSILAHSENVNSHIDIYNLSPNLKYILELYELETEYIETHDNSDIINESSLPTRQNTNLSYLTTVVLERLQYALWDQGRNSNGICNDIAYNKFCPSWYDVDCGRTLVGCTAVAMAQVMWYYQWPYSALIPNSISQSGEPSSSQSRHFYDWEQIPFGLYYDTPIERGNALASLLRDCGYAAKMKYREVGSDASLDDAKDALQDRFSYSSSMRHISRFPRSLSRWIEIMKNEIDRQQPIIYEGYDGNVGHAFILCGYNSNNEFYINMGHAYNGDGWYSLNAIDDVIIGGEEHDLNRKQSAIIGIEPDANCTEGSYIYNAEISVPSDFACLHGDEITIKNITIPTNVNGVIYSENSINLLSGFHACVGSNVRIGIRDFPCGSNSNASMSQDNELEVSSSPSRIQQKKLLDSTIFSVSPNPATNSITISGLSEDATYSIYNLTGEKVRETAETTIDISAFPAGMYVVIATTDGKTYQSKFIKE